MAIGNPAGGHNILCGQFNPFLAVVYYHFNNVTDIYQSATYEAHQRWTTAYAKKPLFKGTGDARHNVTFYDARYASNAWAWVGRAIFAGMRRLWEFRREITPLFGITKPQ